MRATQRAGHVAWRPQSLAACQLHAIKRTPSTGWANASTPAACHMDDTKRSFGDSLAARQGATKPRKKGKWLGGRLPAWPSASVRSSDRNRFANDQKRRSTCQSKSHCRHLDQLRLFRQIPCRPSGWNQKPANQVDGSIAKLTSRPCRFFHRILACRWSGNRAKDFSQVVATQ